MTGSLAPSVVTHRDKKGGKFMDIVADAYDKAGLSEEEAQRVNDTSGLSKLIASFIAKNRVSDRYKHLHVASTMTYPPEYHGAKDLHTQIETLLGILPGLDPGPTREWYNNVYCKLKTPDWVEGPFAVPSEFAMQRQFHSDIQDRASAYCASVSELMSKIATSRKFYNYRDGQIDPRHLWRSENTTEKLDALWELQGRPDIIVLPAQLGFWHRGQAMLCAREKFMGNEFGGGSLEGLAIALTHPERIVRWEQLHMGLPGDEFSFGAGGQAGYAPYLDFSDGKVKFATCRAGCAYEYFGSMSCWLPPQ